MHPPSPLPQAVPHLHVSVRIHPSHCHAGATELFAEAVAAANADIARVRETLVLLQRDHFELHAAPPLQWGSGGRDAAE